MISQADALLFLISQTIKNIIVNSKKTIANFSANTAKTVNELTPTTKARIGSEQHKTHSIPLAQANANETFLEDSLIIFIISLFHKYTAWSIVHCQEKF